MRVLLVSHDFLPGHPSGTEIYTAQLARRLRERGHDVSLFTTEKDISRRHLSLTRREHEGLPVYELVQNLFYRDFRETWDFPPAVQAFAGVLDEVRPEVVHVMHLLYLSVGVVEEAARRGIPVLYTLHDYHLQCARFGQLVHADGSVCHEIDFDRCGTCLARTKLAQTPLERRAARAVAGLRAWSGIDLGPTVRALQKAAPGKGKGAFVPPEAGEAARFERAMAERDRAMRERVVPRVWRFLAPSRFLRDRMEAWGIPENRIEHLSYGLELEPFEGFRRESSEKVRVRFLGTLAPHKAPHLLLEAWRSLPESLRAGAKLAVHGPGRHFPDYVARLGRLAREAGAELSGAVERDEIPGLLARTDLLVVPSTWYENSPLTILEALATRTALLVSDLGGMRELVGESGGGLLFRTGDAGHLAERLAELLGDRARLDEIVAGERDPALVKDMRTSAEEVEERYRAALASRKPEGGA